MSGDVLMTLDAKVDPRHTALIVVDVQNDFADPEGFFGSKGSDLRGVPEMVDRLSSLIQQARSVGVPAVFVQAIYDDEFLSGPMRERNRRRNMDVPRCISGTWGADFYVVKPEPGDHVVVKHRYSAFQGTNLDDLLKELGITSLVLTGIATDVCVESTTRDGYFMDYYTTVVGDCCHAAQEEYHRGALGRLERDYGGVATSEEVSAAWDRHKRAGSTRAALAHASV